MRTHLAVALSALLLVGGRAAAQDPLEDVREGPSCKHCGMDRAKFASTRMVVEFDDGSKLHACSLHCVAVDLALQIDRTPVAIRVADLDTLALIDAERAYWVVGGTRPGVMTKRGKWAFTEKGAAKVFARGNGGLIATFDDAMKAAYEDMYQDTKMIRERRRAKRASRAAAPAAAAPAPADPAAPPSPAAPPPAAPGVAPTASPPADAPSPAR